MRALLSLLTLYIALTTALTTAYALAPSLRSVPRYTRIAYTHGMHTGHARALAQSMLALRILRLRRWLAH